MAADNARASAPITLMPIGRDLIVYAADATFPVRSDCGGGRDVVMTVRFIPPKAIITLKNVQI